MNPQNTICMPLTYQEFYNKEKPNINTLKLSLAKYKKETLLKCVLILLNNTDSWSKIDGFIMNFFSKENDLYAQNVFNKYNEILSSYNKKYNGIIPNVLIYSRHACLELLRIIFSVEFTGENINSITKIELLIFDCLLIVNDITNLTPDCPEDIDDDLKLAYYFLLNMTSYNDFTNIEENNNLILQCHKSKLLFEFLNTQENLQIMRKLYLNQMGFSCWEEYIFVLVKLFILDSTNKLSTISITLKESSQFYKRDKKLIDNFAIECSEEVAYDKNVDYIFFRNCPLIRFNDDYYVIDKNFLANRIYRGLFFGLKEKNNSLCPQYKVTNFFQYFSSKFSEETLFYSVMKNIVGNKSYKNYSGNEMRNLGIYGEPDYYIRNGNDIFLFEFKDSLFPKEDKVECNYENVKLLIETKLVHKNNGKPSAIEQLCNNIKLILEDKFKVDLGIRSNKVRIYPVLVVGDTTFTNIGTNFILNDYFMRELLKRNIVNKNLRPLILVGIDSLLIYQFDFKNKELNLRNVLEDFLKFIKTKRPYSQSNINRNIMHNFFSLDQYLADKIKRKFYIPFHKSLINIFKEKGLT